MANWWNHRTVEKKRLVWSNHQQHLGLPTDDAAWREAVAATVKARLGGTDLRKEAERLNGPDVESMNAFFSSENGKVIVRMRAEGDGGMIGDAIFDIGKGQAFYGLSYDDLLREGAGEIAFKNGRGMIVWAKP